MRLSVLVTLALAMAGCPNAADTHQPGDTDPSGDTDQAGDTDQPGDTASPYTGPDVVADRDLVYPLPSGGNAASSTLDVYYRPDGGPKRLVLLVHGGSWVSGDKENFDIAAPDLIPWWVERDYVVVAVNFRLASPPGGPLEVGPMDQAMDIANALRWIEDHAADYGITEAGAVLLGFSSGAHLVALLGADGQYLETAGLGEEYVAATISLDVHAYDVPYALGLMPGSVVEANIPLIEHLFGDTEAEQLEASPIGYVDGFVADALLITAEPSPQEVGSHGYIASSVTERYAAALQLAGQMAVTHHWNDETHSALVLDFGAEGDAPTVAVEAFLGEVF